MAGSYPDVPGQRFSYDTDGTGCVRINPDTTVTSISSATLALINNETKSDSDIIANTGNPTMWSFVFPNLRNITGIFIASRLGLDAYGCTWSSYYSTNTTNGVDGTWTSFTFPADNIYSNYYDMTPRYRTAIGSVSLSNIKGLRFRAQEASPPSIVTSLYKLHIYGSIATGESPNRLELWHPTLDERVSPAFFDWGDVARGTTTDRTFRVKNLSPSMTATSVILSTDGPTSPGASLAGMHTYSIGGGGFSSTLNIGTLAGGAISDIITVRQIIPVDATLSLWAARIRANATSWS